MEVNYGDSIKIFKTPSECLEKQDCVLESKQIFDFEKQYDEIAELADRSIMILHCQNTIGRHTIFP